ncbi:hypothetical protein AB0K20_32110 [Micromonospora matsumotoense]|uniref:hypothetical protein n=1 Tax=Micromonospora matsumotoense TaxID=121616 RepID=UPI0034225488
MRVEEDEVAPDNEMAEFHQRATAATTAAIQAASQLAQLLIEVRIAQLQRAARASEEQARQARAQARAAQQADAAVWRPATRPGGGALRGRRTSPRSGAG